MKHLIIALMAITIMLGMSCKKENLKPNTVLTNEKKEVAPIDTKIEVSGVVDPTSPGAPGGGEDTYPHNTGACTCGKYASCYPSEYWTFQSNTDGTVKTVRHITAYGQTTFPAGAYFPGNNVYV